MSLYKTNNATGTSNYANPLHQAASVTQVFTLSGLGEQEYRTGTFLKNSPHEIIARTGGIGNANVRDREFEEANTGDGAIAERAQKMSQFRAKYDASIGILERGHDIFFENVNILSTVSPNTERGLADFTRMEFQLHEPYGITFIEKVRAATAINGFTDYPDAPLLLTIEFKGFDEQGRELRFDSKIGTLTRKIPILIAKVDFDVAEGGARYSVTAVRYNDMAFDDRFKFPRTSRNVSGDNIDQWIQQVQSMLLQDQKKNEKDKEKKREFLDTYEFIVHPKVKEYGQMYKSDSDSIHETQVIDSGQPPDITDVGGYGYIESPVQTKMQGEINEGTSLPKAFEDAVRNMFGYVNLANDFWTTYLKKFGYQVKDGDAQQKEKIIQSEEFAQKVLADPMVPWFKIRTMVETDTSRIDSITKMHPKNIVYQAVPYAIHILKLVNAGISKDVDWTRYVRKTYNYLYTGENVDVQNLRINYKTAYYMRNIRETDKENTEAGPFSKFVENFLKVRGREIYPDKILPLRQYPSTRKGRSAVETSNPRNTKAQEFYDYLTNPEADMMRIELDILGDPAYIAQDMYMPVDKSRDRQKVAYGNQGDVFDESSHSFNVDQYMACINLIYRLPADIDEVKEGLMFSATEKVRDEKLFFSGVYQVVKVDSVMDQGSFTQTLTCVRMNNQSGEGLDPALSSSVTKSTDNITKKSELQDNDNRNLIKEAERIGKVFSTEYGDASG